MAAAVGAEKDRAPRGVMVAGLRADRAGTIGAVLWGKESRASWEALEIREIPAAFGAEGGVTED